MAHKRRSTSAIAITSIMALLVCFLLHVQLHFSACLSLTLAIAAKRLDPDMKCSLRQDAAHGSCLMYATKQMEHGRAERRCRMWCQEQLGTQSKDGLAL